MRKQKQKAVAVMDWPANQKRGPKSVVDRSLAMEIASEFFLSQGYLQNRAKKGLKMQLDACVCADCDVYLATRSRPE